MTCQQALNSIGLGLGIVGVLIIFLFGPPQPSLEAGVSLGLEDNTVLPGGRTVAEHNRDVLRRRQLYACMSKIGLSLILVGFGFQLWAVWAQK